MQYQPKLQALEPIQPFPEPLWLLVDISTIGDHVFAHDLIVWQAGGR